MSVSTVRDSSVKPRRGATKQIRITRNRLILHSFVTPSSQVEQIVSMRRHGNYARIIRAL
jgi:hypothetical protein